MVERLRFLAFKLATLIITGRGANTQKKVSVIGDQNPQPATLHTVLLTYQHASALGLMEIYIFNIYTELLPAPFPQRPEHTRTIPALMYRGLLGSRNRVTRHLERESYLYHTNGILTSITTQ